MRSVGSLSNRFRGRRFAAFEELVDDVRPPDGPVRVLDVGGTAEFWRQRGWHGRGDVEITVVNLAEDPSAADTVRSVAGDATDLSPFDDGSFDVVFSNSTIEHLGLWRHQVEMAEEVRRLAPAYWVQTPNYWFPLEPHYLTPGWQYLPARLRTRLLVGHRFGHRGPAGDEPAARTLVEEIRLLTRRELLQLFPDAQLREERIGPLTKSFVAWRAAC